MKYFIVGGAGFVGSNLAKAILIKDKDADITIYDNFSSGKEQHLASVADRVKIIRKDVEDIASLIVAMKGSDIVYHLAANPDISKAVDIPYLDFWKGTYLTNNILEAVRVNGIKRLFFSSGSGVYGQPRGYEEVYENYSPLLPVSPYGASKLASEAMISAYCHMFGISATAFRFANLVGDNQTHGVGHAFIHKLMDNPKELTILGNGKQTKSYLHVEDAIRAMQLVENAEFPGYTYFNVATKDSLTVTEIADMVVDIMELKDVSFKYTGGSTGWNGDVPIIKLNSNKIRNLGWTNILTSWEAMYVALKSMNFFRG